MEVNDTNLVVRVKSTALSDFKTKCAGMGKTFPALVREIVDAFNEGRLRIIPTPKQKETHGELYDEH